MERYIKWVLQLRAMVKEKEKLGDSLFLKFFGDYPLIRVLDFLLEERPLDYTKKEIAEKSGIGLSTLHTFWGRLEGLGIVEETRKIDKAHLYRLDKKSKMVKELVAIDNTLSFELGPRLGRKKSKMAVKAA